MTPSIKKPFSVVHQEVGREQACIAAMLEAASEHHLESEVVWELYDMVKQNPSVDIAEATFAALCEWDL